LLGGCESLPLKGLVLSIMIDNKMAKLIWLTTDMHYRRILTRQLST